MTPSAFLHRFTACAQWTLFTVSAFLAALWLAWQALAQINFGYPLWYELIDIERTIAVYGPRNRYRAHFQTTTQAERVRLFAALVEAIHRQGKGLETLVYHDPAGRPIARFLTPPEILHLRDVAHLLDRLRWIGWGSLLVWLALAGWLGWRRRAPPGLGGLLLIALAVVAGGSALVLWSGPVRVFYGLHTWIFPADHPWFFYYEESLMTMLMRAPVIFGYIAPALIGLALLLWLGLLAGAGAVLRRCASPAGSAARQ